jgi:hypothetical protein
MTSTPSTGDDVAISFRSRSADGQLEQPSEVNNSATTACRSTAGSATLCGNVNAPTVTIAITAAPMTTLIARRIFM